MSVPIESLNIANHPHIQHLHQLINTHHVFSSITSLDHLRKFSEIHVYAVFDFMCLLKSLQCHLAPDQTLWLPPSDPMGAHFINTLVAEEESDELPDGQCLSHFELYVEAMEQIGAQTQAVKHFLELIKKHRNWELILAESEIPSAARAFMHDTFNITQQGSHYIAASLAYARESITADMFGQILKQLAHDTAVSIDGHPVSKFIYYFQRHIV